MENKLVLTFLLLFGIYSSYSLNFRPGPCATLYETQNFTGNNFTVGDGFYYANLESEYTDVESVWNTTNSWEISPGCLMVACNESYFGGHCEEFTNSTPVLSPPLNLGVDSVNCTCANDCRCTDVQMTSRSCARAYLGSDCNTCNPTYTDLKKEKEYFNFQTPVKSLIVKTGCKLTIYEEEKYEGEPTIYENIVEDYEVGAIGSYECSCDPTIKEPVVEKIRNPKFPQFITLPNSVENITELMQGELENHPALRAALQSVKNKRSPKNAYILLLGITGSGKSSAINLLFDNPSVTRVGDRTSTTAAIHEFRIPIKVDELGIENGELRVIDTPGLGDTEGLDRDAKFLATLDEYLLNHDELKDPNRIPNVVLIFHKFIDNRYDGVGSNFVKVLRGLDSFRSRITDKSYSNIIFVFSHFASETKDITRRPKSKLLGFKKVIEDYTLFAKPITMVVGENKPEEQELPMVNGYIKLPNGEYYPKNLFDKIQTITAGGGDPIGGAIITSAFRDSSNFNISHSSMELVGSTNAKVPKYLDVLNGAFYNVEASEISTLIAEAYEKMDPELRKRFPECKFYLQKSMNLRNIKTTEHIPKTTLTIIKLLTSLKLNEANLFLLEHGLKLKPPTLKENIITGYSYNVFRDTPLSISPIQLGDLKSSEIAFTFPSAVTCSVVKKNAEVFKIFENMEAYVGARLQSLNINMKIPLAEYKGIPRPGFNIKGVHILPEGNTTITAVREFRNFELLLNDRLSLTEEFTRTLRALDPFNENNFESVQSWKNFFNEYGTHIVKSAWGGGAIEIQLTSSKPFGADIADALFEFVQFAEDVSIGKRTNRTFAKEGIQNILKFRGGDQAYHTTDLTTMKLSAAADLLENWKESLEYNPAILTSEFRLYPISEVAKKVGQNISSEIQRATELLFKSNLTYVRPTKPGEDFTARENVQYNNQGNSQMMEMMTKLAEAQRQSDERLHKLIEGMTNQTRIAEEKREAARAEQAAWERKQKELQMTRTIEEQKAARELEEKRLEINKQIEMEKIKAEQGRRMWEQNMQAERDRLEGIRQKQQMDMMHAIANRPEPSGGSCLRKGTLITLADGTEKPVEEVQVGDVVLDHKLQPTHIISTLKRFSSDQFFGIEGENDYFFTTAHLIGGLDPREESKIQFYVASLDALYKENPLLENYLAVSQFSNSSLVDILILNRNTAPSSLNSKKVKLVQDPQHSPRDKLVHIITVDSPHGTYFANGVVCRHELPPLELWPNTMNLLFQIVDQPEIDETVEHIEYTVENVDNINRLIVQMNDELELVIKEFFTQTKTGMEQNHSTKLSSIIDSPKSDEILQKVFNDQIYSVLGMGLYSTTGKMLSQILDNPSYELNETLLQDFQFRVHSFCQDFLKKSLGNLL